MRKHAKSVRDQHQTNSNIFKQAKRRFHYQPPQKEKYFISGKPRQQQNQFKDDFSSVKQAKNENNQINQSSWIVKLVNVMHENSEEDVKNVANKQSNDFLSLRPVESKIIISDQIQDHRKCPPVQSGSQQPSSIIVTKKNSVNIEMSNQRKRSKIQASEICDTISRKGKSSSKSNTIKKIKNQDDLKRDRSYSQLKIKEEKQNDFKHTKSVRELPENKGNQNKSKSIQFSKNQQHVKLHSKHFSGSLGGQSKVSKVSQISKSTKNNDGAQREREPFKIIERLKQIQKSVQENQLKEKNNQKQFFLRETPCDLFSNSNHKDINKNNEIFSTVEKRNNVGSIKKNKILSEQSEKKPEHKSYMGVIKKLSPFKQQKKTLQGIITERQQKKLMEKYLNNDYSFKKTSNTFKYEYNTTQFQRPLENVSKLQSQNFQGQRVSQGHFDSKNSNKYSQSHGVSRQQDKVNFQDIGQKKYSYLGDKNNEKETTQNSLSLQILTLRCPPETSSTTYDHSSMFAKKNAPQTVSQRQNQRPSASNGMNLQENLRRIHQKYNYNTNKQVGQKTSHTTTRTTIRDTLCQLKSNSINRNPYLQQSNRRLQQNKHRQNQFATTSSFNYPLGKNQSNRIDPHKNDPNQYCLQIAHMESISKRQRTESQLFSDLESDRLIEKLNTKLNTYIHQHKLQKGKQQKVDKSQTEPTHRKMNLKFNELKKHHELFNN